MRSTRSPSWSRALAGFLGFLGFRPWPLPPAVFAVDGGKLRFARITRAGEGHAVREYLASELPEETFHRGLLGGPMADPARFDDALGALLEAAAAPVTQASLVLPDAWLRASFLELGELPARDPAREEVFRWKLERVVPFRVEDLRLAATRAAPLPGQIGSERWLVGFAIEALLAQLEDAFARRGVHLGQITNRSFATLGACAARLEPIPLGALAVTEDEDYSLLLTRAGEPFLQRYKRLPAGLSLEAALGAVGRDLKLTHTFLQERLPSLALGHVVLVAPADAAASWSRCLGENLEVRVECLQGSDLALQGGEQSDPRFMAPLLGAVAREVS